jgi:hypothetical protein
MRTQDDKMNLVGADIRQDTRQYLGSQKGRELFNDQGVVEPGGVEPPTS